MKKASKPRKKRAKRKLTLRQVDRIIRIARLVQDRNLPREKGGNYEN
jgi:hypothetical protein